MGLLDYADGGRPIDKNRKKVANNDGSFSTERTITIEDSGRFYVIPTLINGVQLPTDGAILMWRGGLNPHVGEFGDSKSADEYARKRSVEIGKVRGGLLGR